MAAASTIMAIAAVAGTAATAYSGYQGAKAAKGAAAHARSESNRAQAMEDERMRNARYGPLARFSPFGFDQVLNILGGSMGGRGMDMDAIRRNMGLINDRGERGPLYSGYDAYQQWIGDDGDPFSTAPVSRRMIFDPDTDQIYDRFGYKKQPSDHGSLQFNNF